jgi:hypothetical protein
MKTRVYPLSEADAPAENEWVNWTELAYNTIHANDVGFFSELDEVVQEEPEKALDAERAGLLAALGIVKGRPFDPDERMRGILGEAARVVDGARSYRLHVEPDVPAKTFWAVDLYDTQTRSLLQIPPSGRPSAAAPERCRPTTTARTTSTSPRRRPPATSPTGSRRSPASRGSRSCGSTAHSSPGSTRPGSSTTSNPATELRRANRFRLMGGVFVPDVLAAQMDEARVSRAVAGRIPSSGLVVVHGDSATRSSGAAA